MKKYPVVNGKSLCSVYKKFLKEIFCVEGHLLLVGVTGSGKSALAERYRKHVSAEYFDFQCKEISIKDVNRLSEMKNAVCILDGIVFDSEQNKEALEGLIDLLRKSRKSGCAFVVLSQTPPKPDIQGLFEAKFVLSRIYPESGVGLERRYDLISPDYQYEAKGKGGGLVIPETLKYADSVVVYDPHADFYKIRSDWGLKNHE